MTSFLRLKVWRATPWTILRVVSESQLTTLGLPVFAAYLRPKLRRASPVRTALFAPNLTGAEGWPLLNRSSSMMSSWTSVPLWTSSRARNASFVSLKSPPATSAQKVHIMGLRRLPPLVMAYSAGMRRMEWTFERFSSPIAFLMNVSFSPRASSKCIRRPLLVFRIRK